MTNPHPPAHHWSARKTSPSTDSERAEVRASDNAKEQPARERTAERVKARDNHDPKPEREAAQERERER